MIEMRLRSKISPEELKQKVGKLLTDDDYNLLLHRDAVVRKPDGSILAVYRRGALEKELLDRSYATLHELRSQESDNRGYASAMPRMRKREFDTRTRTPLVPSMIVGAMDAGPPFQYCRLTAWSGKETEKFAGLYPLFQEIGGFFAREVPDRYSVQMRYVQATHPDWLVPGTPFTTITVNNSYPTGVHTDAGDLAEGFSNLSVLRRGSYRGGRLVFPEYRVAVDMHHGDVLLMDAHEWHGNTQLICNECDRVMPVRDEEGKPIRGAHDACGTERISIVCYYRTEMKDCGSPEEEAARAKEWAEHRIALGEAEQAVPTG